MTAVFLDTSFLIALENADDQYRPVAQTCWQDFQRNPLPLVTTSYILDETVTFFNSRGFHSKAVEIGQCLLASPGIQLIHVDESLFQAGWRWFIQHDDKRYSLTDSISFALMKQLDLKTAFSFDKHFSQAGFVQKP